MADNLGQFQTGHTPWNKELKGIHLSPQSEFKKGHPKTKGATGMSPWNKDKSYEQVRDEKHVWWKGDDASYSSKHKWIVVRLGRPLECSECGKTGGTTRNYHWANISKKYKRELDDWVRLCVSCHKLYDLKKLELSHVG